MKCSEILQARVFGNTRLKRQALLVYVCSTLGLMKQVRVSWTSLRSSMSPGWGTHLAGELPSLNPTAPALSRYQISAQQQSGFSSTQCKLSEAQKYSVLELETSGLYTVFASGW